MQIEFSRKTTPLDILRDGNKIGSIRHSETKTPYYIVRLKGIYFNRDGEPNTKSGLTTQRYRALGDAKIMVPHILEKVSAV